MASQIRELLAAAQQAEVSGDVDGAVRHLEAAALFYRDRGMHPRAQQMLRQARRLLGHPESEGGTSEQLPQQHLAVEAPDLGFGDELMDRPTPLDQPAVTPGRRRRELTLFERSPTAADPRVDAWCSFCCKPRAEVGPLVAGPAGAFVCQRCARISVAILGGGAAPLVEAPPPTDPELAAIPEPSRASLPSQERAWARWERMSPRFTLIVGPEGAGKSALLRRWGRPAELPFAGVSGERLLLDLGAPLPEADERAVLTWADAHPLRKVILAVRGQAPAPVLILQSEHGDTPIHDTSALRDALGGALSLALLSRVDAVLPLEPPTREDLVVLALGLLEARGAQVPPEATERLVGMALQSGRGAHELAALVSRIPAGRHGAR